MPMQVQSKYYNLSEKCVFSVLVSILDNQLLEHIYFIPPIGLNKDFSILIFFL